MKILKALRLNSLLICIFVLFSLFTTEAIATTYYVSPTGNDSNSGSSNYPFKTIQKAADIVNPGDTVIVKDGVYTDTNGDNFIINLNRGGSSSAWITFKAENKWGAKLNGQSNTTGYGWNFASNAKYVRVEDFEIYGCLNGGFWLNSTANNIYFYRNNIHDIGRECTNDAYGRAGVYLGTLPTYITFDSNVWHHIGRYGWPGAPPEYQCDPPNEYDGTHDGAIYSCGSYIDIFNNIFYENNSGNDVIAKAQYAVDSGDHYKIINNTFGQSKYKRNGRIGLVGVNLDGYRNDDILIQNNTFRSSNVYAIQIWPYESGLSGIGQKNAVIKNNYTYGETLIWPIDAAYLSNFTFANNTVKGADQKFVNLANYNFRLQFDSPAINKGIPSGINYDADGIPRDSAPDIGAYEYIGTKVADTTPPAAPKLY